MLNVSSKLVWSVTKFLLTNELSEIRKVLLTNI